MKAKTATSARFIAYSALIAAIYAVLTIACWSFSSMQIQVRISEALCVLPLFTPAAIPGLFLGCFISNLIAGNIPDAVFGSLATLAAAFLTWLIGRLIKRDAKIALAPFPAVILNALVVPFILYFGYGVKDFMGFDRMWPVLALIALSVFIGQVIACYGLGVPLYFALKPLDRKYDLFGSRRDAAAVVKSADADSKEKDNRQN